jgi:hypothetical protein
MIFERGLRNCPIRTKYLSYPMYKLAGFFPVQVQTHAKNLMIAGLIYRKTNFTCP